MFANFVELFGCLFAASTENVLPNNPSLGNIVLSVIISQNHNFFIQVLKFPHIDTFSSGHKLLESNAVSSAWSKKMVIPPFDP